MWLTNKSRTILAILLLMEVGLYSWSFSQFFHGDSLFYLCRLVSTPAEVIQKLIHVDGIDQYRPLTYFIFSFLLYPFFKLNPFGYHFIPLLFHMINTVLVYLFLKKLTGEELISLIGTFFFGIHSVDLLVTYDIAFLSDFVYGMFYMLSLFFILKHIETERNSFFFLSIFSFILCLMSKESAVTLPFNMILCIYLKKWLFPQNKVKTEKDSFLGLRNTYSFFLILASYLVFLDLDKGGHFFPQDSAHVHHIEFNLRYFFRNLVYYLKWTFNFPGRMLWNPPQLIAITTLIPFMVLLIVYTIRMSFRKDKLVIFGLVWFIVSLLPVIFLANKPETHCLYIPIVGMGLVVGHILGGSFFSIKGLSLPFPKVILLSYLSVTLLACIVNYNGGWKAIYWLKENSKLTKNFKEDVMKFHPTLKKDSMLYFLKTSYKYFPWITDSGRMYKLYYDESIKAYFEDSNPRISAKSLIEKNAIIFRYYNKHLYDVTEEYLKNLTDSIIYKLMDHTTSSSIFYYGHKLPSYDLIPSPNMHNSSDIMQKPVFVYTFPKGDGLRDAIIMAPGASIRFPIPKIKEGWKLHFGVAMPSHKGNKIQGFIYFEDKERRDLLYSKVLDPVSHSRWFDETIDLSKYAEKEGALVFECRSNFSPRKERLGWSRLWIVPGEGLLK